MAAALLKWYDAHARILPWREKRPDPYRVWLSEIMLQQTTVAAVKDYFLKFVAKWPNVQALAAAPLDDVLKAWAGLGYYARARNLHACAKVVAGEHNGRFPEAFGGLLELPGIGPYTAGAIGAIAFDIPVAAVDGNVERVISRYYGIADPLPGTKPLIKRLTETLVPQKRAGDFAQAMMDLGATICTPKSPSCLVCPWNEGCVARAQGIQAELPRKAAKKTVPTRTAHVYWVSNSKGEVLVRQRAMKGLLAGMTEFPSSTWQEGEQDFVAPFAAEWKRVPGIVEHTFTHFHFEMIVWKSVSDQPVLDGRFVPVESLMDEALPSVMRKVAAHVLKGK
ncbi:A/G-specific adenine glycosylase [Aestuariivirga litoralis]|uniref:A/G-specific adenine glycosylase n=1 Tax=Aestuariivirga litoralis TaxID=2650924 RepID=UPI0018C66076|nr:A/G-specific adenine glycosylase [Aestuariivirga litoralis]MBG1233335.1 A/G-specific adenine glycosylase [Aestuariivirga litoralis]